MWFQSAVVGDPMTARWPTRDKACSPVTSLTRFKYAPVPSCDSGAFDTLAGVAGFEPAIEELGTPRPVH